MATEPIELPVLDDDPKGGYWAPEVTEIDATPEEIAEGNALGQANKPRGVR